MKTKIAFLLLVALFIGCKAQSPKLEAPVVPYEATAVNADVQKVDVTPRADILFIVDYSTSMGKHQRNLATNVKNFVDEFSKSKLLDYHIGVAPIYDHCHFDLDGVCKDKTKANYPLGQLLPLKNSKGEKQTDGDRFITRSTPNSAELLYNTLLVGEAGGPQFEEMFIPVLPALSSDLAAGPNKGFYRQDAYLILVFITDGDDSSTDPRLNPIEFANSLFALKGGRQKVLTVGVISPTAERSCAKDQSAAKGPVKMEQFLQYTNGETLSLCNPKFGVALGNIGRNLAAKIPSQVIALKGIPDFHPKQKFTVMYGNQEIPRDYDNGWSFESGERNAIVIGPNTVFEEQPGAGITINFTPITAENVNKGKVKSMN